MVVWVDQTNGNLVWAVHPWGINAIVKNDASTPLLGESGEVLDAGGGGDAPSTAGSDELLDATFIDATGGVLRYNVGLRYRGNGCIETSLNS